MKDYMEIASRKNKTLQEQNPNIQYPSHGVIQTRWKNIKREDGTGRKIIISLL